MKEDAMPKSPRTVTAAVSVLYLSLGLGVIQLLLRWSKAEASGSLGPEVGPLLTLALIYYMIWRGRNWARIIYLILVLLGTPLSLLAVIQLSGHSDFSGSVGAHLLYIEIIQIGIHLVAVVLLFQRASSHWFKTMKKLRSKDESHGAI
jgi:hypothetical protein